MAKTETQRKRDERDRKRAAGLIPVQEWVHREDADRLRRYAVRLRRERDRGVASNDVLDHGD